MLFYVYDPMCSWCWAYQPTLVRLREMLNQADIVHTELLGGLAPDTDQAMPHPMRQQIQSYWHQIEAKLGTPFNHDFWTNNTPRRATYPACRAVIAARNFDKAIAMHEAIQRAYYTRALNPSDDATLIQLADEIGLPKTFSLLLNSAETHQSLLDEICRAREIGGTSFPSWIYVDKGKNTPLELDYTSADTTFRDIVAIADNNRPKLGSTVTKHDG